MKKLILISVAVLIVVSFLLFLPVEIFSIKPVEKTDKLKIFSAAFKQEFLKLSAPAKAKDLFIIQDFFDGDKHFIIVVLKKYQVKMIPLSYSLRADLFENQQIELLAGEFANSFLRCLKIIEKTEKEKKKSQFRLPIPKVF